MDWTQVVYVTAWHRAFFRHLIPQTHDEQTNSKNIASLLRLLEACGYAKCSTWLDKLRDKTSVVDWASIYTSLQAAAQEATSSKLWPQHFLTTCALHTFSDNVSASGTAASNIHNLSDLLTTSLSSMSQSAGESVAAVEEEEQAWWREQVQAALSLSATTDTSLLSSQLFTLTVAGTSTSATLQADLMQVWHEARLYGMLALATSFTDISALARLMALYVMQEHAALAYSLFDESNTEKPIHVTASKKNETSAQVVTRRQCMRVRGLVCGVVEYVLHMCQAEASRVRHALNTLQNNTSTTHRSSTPRQDTPVPDVLPRVGEEAVVRTTAVLLLTKVAEQLSLLDKLLQSGSSPSPSSLVSEEWGLSVLHTMHELVFTVVLGGGTREMPNRPAAPSRNTTTTSTTYLTLPYAVTRRALTLAEADAFIQGIFPALLQQLGYEWQWSAMLRHCRGLDRLSLTPSTSTNNNGTAHQSARSSRCGCIASQMPVRWTSRMLLDSLLLALRTRTYPERLQQVLPPSYDRVLEALGLAVVAHNHDDNEEGERKDDNKKNSTALFTSPAYYAEAGAVLVEYFTRTSLTGWTEAEVQRLLFQSTASLPMLVQLRALAPRTTLSPLGEATHITTPSEQRNEEEQESEEDESEYELTAAQVHVLETRYRAEVLLASIIVYTQLRVPSQVQHAMRQAGPLLTRLLLELHDFYRQAGLQPFLVRRGQAMNESTGLVAGFTRVAELLVNRVGYQFYPFEWLLSYAQAYGQQLPAYSTFADTAINTSTSMPYSVYAAVGHQFGVTLINVPQGSMGEMAQRLPCGPRAALLTAPTLPSSLLHTEGEDEEEEHTNMNSEEEGSNKAWQCVERFVSVGMLDVYLQARTASWELEGPLAIASTRRLTPHNNHPSSTVGTAMRAALLLSSEPLTYSEDITHDGESNNSATSNSNGEAAMTTTPVWQPKLWHLLCTQGNTNNNSSTQERAGVRALRRVLLQAGAASFADVPRAADFVATLAQCFLPSSTTPSTQGKGQGSGRTDSLVSQKLLQGAQAWCRARVANGSDMARLRSLAQQLGNSNMNNKTDAVCEPLAGLYNSATFDASALARMVLREVPARLRAKLEQRLHEEQEYQDSVANEEDKQVEHRTSEKKRVTVVPDPLLMHQWSIWQEMLHSLGLESEGSSHNNTVNEDVRQVVPSVTQWLWYSPYAQGQDVAMTSAGQPQSNEEVDVPTQRAMSGQATLSVSELRTAVQQHLQRSGALRQLKTQLRAMMLEGVLQQRRRLEAAALRASTGSSAPLRLQNRATTSSNTHYEAAHMTSGGRVKPALQDMKAQVVGGSNEDTDIERTGNITPTTTLSLPPLSVWAGRVVDALIENHLRHTQRALSLALFSTEAEVMTFSEDGAPASEEVALRSLLGLDSAAAVAPEGTAIDSIPPPTTSSSSSPLQGGMGAVSVLQRLVERHLRHSPHTTSSQAEQRFALTLCDNSTQTEIEGGGTKSAGMTLESRLAAIDAAYALRFARLRRPVEGDSADTNEYHSHACVPGRIGEYSLDRRLERYKREMHELLQAEYERQRRVFEQDALQRVRDEAEARCRVYIENKEQEYAEKARSAAAKQAIAQDELREGRAMLEQQRALLESRKREMAEQINIHEAEARAARNEMQALKEKMRGLQLQCGQWQELATTRLMEAEAARAREQRRVEEMRVMQKDHDTELRLKEEEIMQLRLKLRVLMRHGGFPASSLQQQQQQQGVPVVHHEQTRTTPAATEQQQAALIDQTSLVTRREAEEQRPAMSSPLAAQLAAVPVAEIAPLPQPQKESALPRISTTTAPQLLQQGSKEAAGHATLPVTHEALPSPAQEPPIVQQTTSSIDSTTHSTTTAAAAPATLPTNEPARDVAATTALQSGSETSHKTQSTTTTSTTAHTSKSSGDRQSEADDEENTAKIDEAEKAAAAAAAEEAKQQRDRAIAEAQRSLQESESSTRDEVAQEEVQARQGLQWSAKAQLDVLRAQVTSEKHHNDTDNSDEDEDDSANFFLGARAGRRAGLMQRGAFDAAGPLPSQTSPSAAVPLIRHDSDDDDDDDEAILFGRKRGSGGGSSSSSSF